jgi:transcriptional regulator with XRE-family HTH domain
MAAAPDQRNEVAIAFGGVLRQARARSGLSQEALGLACDIDRTYVSLLERGERQPSLSTIFALCEHLGASPELLVAQTWKALRR